LDALQEGYVFCNHYENFNDPFECWCIVNTGIPDPEKEEQRFLNVIKVWGFPPEMANVAKEDYFEYLENFEDECIDVDYHINSARISCFSNDPTNLLMWAHYAAGLRGFCIEFDSEKFFLDQSQDAEIINVNYLNAPPILETICYPLANDIYWHAEDEDSDQAVDFMRDFYSKMLASKPKEWEYEKEVRLIYHSKNQNKSGEKFNYNKSAIKSIVIGEKMSTENQNVIFDTVKKSGINIPIKIAKRDRENYKVVLQSL